MNKQQIVRRACVIRSFLVVLTLASSSIANASVYTSIDLAGVANDQLSEIQPGYPTGLPVLLGGVPFHISPTGDNIFNSNVAAGQGPGAVSLDLPINLAGVSSVHTLINTGWGQPGPDAFASLTFNFTDSTTLVQTLIGGVDIRDHFQGEWTNTISGTTTNVFSTVLNGHAGVGEYRIDKQYFDLTAFSDKTLASITLTDSGDFELQRTYLFGLTVETVPEPSSIGLAVVAAVILLARRKFRNGCR